MITGFKKVAGKRDVLLGHGAKPFKRPTSYCSPFERVNDEMYLSTQSVRYSYVLFSLFYNMRQIRSLIEIMQDHYIN